MIKLNGQKKVVRQAVSQLSFDHTVCHIASSCFRQLFALWHTVSGILIKMATAAVKPGRPKTSPVWDYFKYDRKTVCQVDVNMVNAMRLLSKESSIQTWKLTWKPNIDRNMSCYKKKMKKQEKWVSVGKFQKSSV